MCYGCWVDDYGSSKDIPDGGEATVALIQELYSREDGFTGALLHVALDDYNLEDKCVIPFRLENKHLAPEKKYLPEYTDRTVELCELISEQLLTMSEDQRAAVIAKAHGWF